MTISSRRAAKVSAAIGSHEAACADASCPDASGADAAPIPHGGDLAAARRLFPDAPQPFVDLSTGINPHAYPVPPLRPDLFTALPQASALAELLANAAQAYGAPSPAHVVAAPGTQILLAQVTALVPPGRAAVLGPTYAEHARAAALAGHRVRKVTDAASLSNADLAVVVNPNNPDGRVAARKALLACAGALPARGLLVVDEAFMDVGPPGASLAGDVGEDNIVVLRSFGKFYGLAGLRLGFAIAQPTTAVRLAAALGPWAVAGPAIAIGASALADRAWADEIRARLAPAALRLDRILTAAGLEIVGGTLLFRLARTHAAGELFQHLGRAGILVRRFAQATGWLRFGLPAGELDWARLADALAAFRPVR